MRTLSGLVFIVPALVRSVVIWWSLAVVLAISNAQVWYVIDNHKYLITYWTIACCVSLHGQRGPGYLRSTARLLVGLSFLYATAWKVLYGEYFDGTFWLWTMLTDGRVDRLVAALLDRPVMDVSARASMDYFRSLGRFDTLLSLKVDPGLLRLAILFSWFAVALEGLIAATHMAWSQRLYASRHALLFGFVATTYFLLQVSGFAFVLCVLGMAQCRDDDDFLRLAYIVLFAVVQIQQFPWQSILR